MKPIVQAVRPKDIDATELNHDEWFFLWAAFGMQPDAKMKDIQEWQTRSAGLSRKEQLAHVQRGMESLVARGFLVPATNADGSVQTDAQGNVLYKGGRIVSRIKSIEPMKLT